MWQSQDPHNKYQVGVENGGEGGTFLYHVPSSKRPMFFISSHGMSLLGPIKNKHCYSGEKGAIVYHNWILKQPHVMVVYCSSYNAIGWLKKKALGHVSIYKAIGKRIGRNDNGCP